MNPFDEIDALAYDEWYEKNRDVYLKELACVRKLSNEKCVDIGGGTGRFSDWLVVDLSINMLKVARAKGFEVVNATCESLPFRDRAFPCAKAVTLFCFVRSPERCLREMLRISEYAVICIIEKGSSLARKYEEKGKRGHKLFSKASFLSLDFFKTFLDIEDICTPIEGFICFRGIRRGNNGSSGSGPQSRSKGGG